MEDNTPLTAGEMIENFKRWFQQFMGGYAEIAITDYKNVVAAEVAQQTASLQDRITELEEGNTKLHFKCIKDKTEAYKQIHQVMTLFEEQYKAMRFAIHFKTQGFNTAHQMAESDWQSFLKEHGLTE